MATLFPLGDLLPPSPHNRVKRGTFVVRRKSIWYQSPFISILSIYHFGQISSLGSWNRKSTLTNQISFENIRRYMKDDGFTSIVKVRVVHFQVFWRRGKSSLNKGTGVDPPSPLGWQCHLVYRFFPSSRGLTLPLTPFLFHCNEVPTLRVPA